MSPALLASIVQYIALAISAARELEPAVVAAKKFVTALFEKGLLTKEQQAAVHAYVDAVASAGVNGDPPPAWTVEPDPG
jgi:hypothetical protein